MKYQRLYPLYLTIALLIVIAELLYLPVYWLYAPRWSLAVYGFFALCTVIGCSYVLRGGIERGHWVMTLGTTASVSFGCYIYGSYTGIEYYFFGLVSGTLLSALSLRSRTFLMLSQTLAGIVLVIYGSKAAPVAVLPEPFLSVLRLANWIDMSLFTMLIAIATTYFVDALGEDADIDGLTGAYNRRAMTRHGYWLHRTDTAYELLVFDLDHFKQFNDTHGHALGDKVLKYFVATLARVSRQQDFIARIGGEEFVMILPDLSHAEARKIAERIRQELVKVPFYHDEMRLTITVSIGMGASSEAGTVETVIAKADARLYQAKANGRDCIEDGDGDLPRTAVAGH